MPKSRDKSSKNSLQQFPSIFIKFWLQFQHQLSTPATTMTTTMGLLILLCMVALGPIGVYCETKCWKRKYYVTILGGRSSAGLNTTISCPQYYTWTISDYCCYDGYDRFDTRPFCCYSETYKLAVAVGLICLVLFGVSCSFFLCWLYNIPHYLLKLITCGKFSLNDYMKKSLLNGPYVDPSFYTGEPFWSAANSELQPYPLRPMPPGIFYPTGSIMKSRWSNQHLLSTGQMPLFIVASRQFTRNPYSARPNDRQSSVCSISSYAGGGGGGGHDSRRSSTTSNYKSDNRMPTLNFRVNIDEVEAAAELLDALKRIENKDKNFVIPKLVEETQTDLDLLDETLHVSSAVGSGCRNTTRVGSSYRNSVSIKPLKDHGLEGVSNRFDKDDYLDEEEVGDDDDGDDDAFVVPVKGNIGVNELGQTYISRVNTEPELCALESVKVQGGESEKPTSSKTKSTGSIGNTQNAVEESPNNKNIPGLISEQI